MTMMRTGACCGLSRLAKGCCLALLAAGFSLQQAAAADDHAPLSGPDRQSSAHEGAAAPSSIETQAVTAHRPKRASFELERASHEARHVADWVVDSGDNDGMPFAIVDSQQAPHLCKLPAAGRACAWTASVRVVRMARVKVLSTTSISPGSILPPLGVNDSYSICSSTHRTAVPEGTLCNW